MPALDSGGLQKAMDKAGFSSRRLAQELGLSLQYVCDMTAGRRKLKRNPALRKQIAQTLDVPVHWIEVAPPAADEAS